MPHIVPIVEGHGEVDAVPVLLRRIATELGAPGLTIGRPIRCPRQLISKDYELGRVVDLAARRVEAPGPVLILLDADADCPALLGPELQRRATEKRPDATIRVVLAKREYEAWFLAAVESLRERGRVTAGAAVPEDPEEIQGAKEYLERLMGRGGVYSETIDQPALSAMFDLRQARTRSPSFDKLWREMERLAQAM